MNRTKAYSVKALLFAAGLGTRLKEQTQTKPKALVLVAGKPLLQHAIEHLKKFGIKDLTINVHHFANQIISFLQENNFFDIQIQISNESDELLDTGGGLNKASEFLSGTEQILIYNVDVISNLDLNVLLKYHMEHQSLATLVVRSRETSRYLMFDQNLDLTGWKNYSNGETRISRPETFPESKPLAFNGIHIIQPKILDLITEKGKFSIMDLYLRLAKSNSIKAFIDQSEIWLDLGKPEQLVVAEKIFRK